MKKAVLLEAKAEDSVVTALGVEVAGAAQNLRIIVNGVDITENIKFSTLQVVLTVEEAK